MRRTSRRRALGLAIGALLCSAPAAAGAPGWTAPNTLGPSYAAALAIDHDGKAILLSAGRPTTGPTMSSYVHPVSPEGWQTQVLGQIPCAEGDYCGQFVLPDVVLDEGGTALGTWGSGWSNPFNTSTVVAIRPAGGSWRALPDPPDGYGSNPGVSLAVGPVGSGLFLWNCFYCDDNGGFYAAARSISSAGVSTRHFLADPREGTGSPPRGGVDAAGRATVVWGSSLGVRWASREMDGSWSAAGTLAPGFSPLVSVAPDGTAEAVWTDEGDMYASGRVGPYGVRGTPVKLGRVNGEMDLAIDSGDKAIAAWTGSDGVVWVAVRPAGAGWTITRLAAGSAPAVAVNSAGIAFVVFLGPTGAPLVSIRPAGGVWGDPTPLDAAGASSPAVAADGKGDAVAAWIDAAGRLRTATWDATGPEMATPAGPERVTAGDAATFTAGGPYDLWSGLAGVSWDFGDGGSATGMSVTHAYTAPGTYAVTATATDGLGNATSRSRSVTVTAPIVTPPLPRPPMPPSTSGTVGGVGAGLPGASAATTPRPLPPAVIRRLPRLKVVVRVPQRLRVGSRAIVAVRTSRPLRGALVRVQLRRGVRYVTIAQGRVSGRRIPVALSFRAPGRYLVRIQILERGRRAVAVVRPVIVRR